MRMSKLTVIALAPSKPSIATPQGFSGPAEAAGELPTRGLDALPTIMLYFACALVRKG